MSPAGGEEAITRAEDILRRACGDRVRTDYPLAPLTTFRIGGPAALYLEPESVTDLESAGEAIRDTEVPFAVLGKGSNVLISDDGFRGLVLRLGKGFRWTGRDGTTLTAGSAMPVPALAGVAFQHGLAGLEFGVAIPATLGGAVRMNAGAHSHSMSEVLSEVNVFLLGEGRMRPVSAADAGLSYRRSNLPDDGIVVSAVLDLAEGDRHRIKGHMDEAREWRRATQPLAEPNCGSVFKNPPEDHAARLVEESGGKGLAVGGAQVSEKHANFIVASPGATAADVVALIRRIREVVRERSGVELEPEVHLIGDFSQTPL